MNDRKCFLTSSIEVQDDQIGGVCCIVCLHANVSAKDVQTFLQKTFHISVRMKAA